MKLLTLAALLLPVIALGQGLQEKADSVMIHFFGNDNFQQFIQRVESVTTTTDGTQHFSYRLNRPELRGHPLVITFSLHANGQLNLTEAPYGLVRVSPADTVWTTAREALRQCKADGRSIKRRSLKLVWNTTDVSYDLYRKTGNLSDIASGTLAWEVKGKTNFRGTIYKGRFQVNVLTGRLARLFSVPWD